MVKNILLGFSIITLVLLTACSKDPERKLRVYTPVSVNIDMGVTPMENNLIQSRAEEIMEPSLENPIRSLAIFQFDEEGQHDRNLHYHYLNFVDDDTPTGVLTTTLKDLTFDYLNGTTTTICVVANVSPEEVSEFYEDCRIESGELGRIELFQLKEWQLTFDYVEQEEGGKDTQGHIKEMYMFGYYEGKLKEGSNDLKIILGRLVARLDITLETVDESIQEKVAYHLDNIVTKAYVFPGDKGGEVDDESQRFTTVFEAGTLASAGTKVTRYFYVAGHSADKAEEATTLHLYYGNNVSSSDLTGGIKIPLCNTPPSETANPNYWLNRNSIYSFVIRIKNSKVSGISRSTEPVQKWYLRPDGVQVIDIELAGSK